MKKIVNTVSLICLMLVAYNGFSQEMQDKKGKTIKMEQSGDSYNIWDAKGTSLGMLEKNGPQYIARDVNGTSLGQANKVGDRYALEDASGSNIGDAHSVKEIVYAFFYNGLKPTPVTSGYTGPSKPNYIYDATKKKILYVIVDSYLSDWYDMNKTKVMHVHPFSLADKHHNTTQVTAFDNAKGKIIAYFKPTNGGNSLEILNEPKRDVVGSLVTDNKLGDGWFDVLDKKKNVVGYVNIKTYKLEDADHKVLCTYDKDAGMGGVVIYFLFKDLLD